MHVDINSAFEAVRWHIIIIFYSELVSKRSHTWRVHNTILSRKSQMYARVARLFPFARTFFFHRREIFHTYINSQRRRFIIVNYGWGRSYSLRRFFPHPSRECGPDSAAYVHVASARGAFRNNPGTGSKVDKCGGVCTGIYPPVSGPGRRIAGTFSLLPFADGRRHKNILNVFLLSFVCRCLNRTKYSLVYCFVSKASSALLR